jgi:hypothetical protein
MAPKLEDKAVQVIPDVLWANLSLSMGEMYLI